MRHAWTTLENSLAIIDFATKDDKGGMPNAIDLLPRQGQAHGTRETVAEIVYVELDVGRHG